MTLVADRPDTTTAASSRAVLYLRAHREARGLGTWQLAHRAGVALTTVLRMESDDAAGITYEALGAVAHALGVTPAALFEPPR